MSNIHTRLITQLFTLNIIFSDVLYFVKHMCPSREIFESLFNPWDLSCISHLAPPPAPPGLNHYIDYKTGLQGSHITTQGQKWLLEKMRTLKHQNSTTQKALEDTWKLFDCTSQCKNPQQSSRYLQQKSSATCAKIINSDLGFSLDTSLGSVFIVQHWNPSGETLKCNNFAHDIMISVETLLRYLFFSW